MEQKMAEEKKDEKKIIIDEDWKQQAKKEKDVLAAEEESQKETQEEGHRELPVGDFAALISMLFTQTLYAFGLIQVKGQDRRPPDLALAKYNIDMLETLEAKTKGNLNAEEQQAITGALSELRMVYVKFAGQAGT
jgi:hypothetical protein